MPELPDIVVYQESLRSRTLDSPLLAVRLANPFVLRTAVPPISQCAGKRVRDIRRVGKRLVIELDGSWFLVLHLMIAGRLTWLEAAPKTGAKPKPPRHTLVEFEFDRGVLCLTEAGTRRRASLHLIDGEAALAGMDPGGLEFEQADLATFATRLRAANHTLKRALTDPHILAGIGNAYSDEILHRAQLSPIALTQKISNDQMEHLFAATRRVLQEWTDRLRTEAAGRFPEKVTAFRPQMAVHGRFGKPCPVCASAVQRIVYADHETNYCARCQTDGVILRDRALSRLLRSSWPRSIDELG